MKHRLSKNKRVKKTTNRKHITKDPLFNFEGVDYEINVQGLGVYREMMQSIMEQLHIGLEIHKRLMVVRFDLHSKSFEAGNEEIRAFRRRIMVWIERTYKTRYIGYVWVRERETTKHQHYHFSLWIDGNKIQHPKKLLAHIMQKWEEIDPSNHHMPSIKNPFYFIGNKEELINPNSKADKGLVYRLSYLAKVRGKGYRPEQVKDFSTSRVKLNLKDDNMKKRLLKLEASHPQKIKPTDTRLIIESIKQRHAIGSPCYCVKCRGKAAGGDGDKIVQRLRVAMFDRETSSGVCYMNEYKEKLAAYKKDCKANG